MPAVRARESCTGRRPGCGDVTNPQLRLRRARPRDHVDPRRLRQRRFHGDRLLGPPRPSGKRVGGEPMHHVVLAIADGNQRRARRSNGPCMELAHIIDHDGGERLLRAHGGVPIWIVAVYQLDEGAVGDRAWGVPELRQPVETQLPHADEIGFADGLRVMVSAPLISRIVLYRDGTAIDEKSGSKVEFLINSKGAYRVEAYLDSLPAPANGKPWILSNPIYVR